MTHMGHRARHTGELLAHLARLVSFRTTADRPGEKTQCLDWIAKTFLEARNPSTPLGASVQRGTVEGAPYLLLDHPSPKLLWFAHVDVVPGSDAQFTVEVRGDRASGRGVKDMKGAALPFLLAYREACEGAVPPISILLTSDEETAGHSIRTLLEQERVRAPVAFTPDTGSNPHIVVEHKGVVWADLTVRGKGTHGALPWEGENPVPLLAEALLKLTAAFPPGTAEDWRVTVSPTKLTGSSARNVVPSEAQCALDIRFPPEVCPTADDALALVSRHLPSSVQLTATLTANPLKTDPQHPMVQRVKRIAEEVMGSPVPIGREHGASDARFFQDFGIPAFLYGPTGGGLHSSDEWVSIPSLFDHREISRRLLAELMKHRES